MLPIIPILVLAYAVLYAFAFVIPPGYAEQRVQDAITVRPTLTAFANIGTDHAGAKAVTSLMVDASPFEEDHYQMICLSGRIR